MNKATHKAAQKWAAFHFTAYKPHIARQLHFTLKCGQCVGGEILTPQNRNMARTYSRDTIWIPYRYRGRMGNVIISDVGGATDAQPLGGAEQNRPRSK